MKNTRDISRKRQRIEIEKGTGKETERDNRNSRNSNNNNNERDSLNSNSTETEKGKEKDIMISRDRDMRCMTEVFDPVILVIHNLDTMRTEAGVELLVEVQVVLQDPCLQINIDMEAHLHHQVNKYLLNLS